MRRFLTLLLVLFVMPSVAFAQARKPVVAVVNIEDLANTGRADSLSAMIETAIASTGKFRLMERQRMGHLVGEQARARGGMVTSNSPRRTGGFEGVDYLIYGTITSVSAKQKQDIGATLLSGFLSGNRASAQSCSRTVGTLAVDIKITDADSGEIKYVTRINQQQTSAATCGEDGKIDSAALIRAAADRVAAGLVTSIYPIQVAAVEGDGSVILNYGEGTLELGQLLSVYSKGTQIRDPASGEVIGNNETKLGLVRVSEVSNRISHAIPVTTFASSMPVGSILRQASDSDIQAASNSKKRK